MMQFREAQPTDIPALLKVRFSVTENVLRNRALVTAANTEEYLFHRGKGWVCEVEGQVVGFAIADLRAHNVWALFVRPAYVGHTIGKQLLGLLLTWYFAQTQETIELSTAPGTRAEEFYRRQGWREIGRTSSGEVQFELTAATWRSELNKALLS